MKRGPAASGSDQQLLMCIVLHPRWSERRRLDYCSRGCTSVFFRTDDFHGLVCTRCSQARSCRKSWIVDSEPTLNEWFTNTSSVDGAFYWVAMEWWKLPVDARLQALVGT